MFKKFNLQLFADETAVTETSATTQEKTTTETEPAPVATVKDTGEKKYSDEDVNKILDKKFAEWQKKQQKKVHEAEKLATMNATQKAEYERDKLQKELDEYKKQASLAEMSKTARKMLADSGISVPDELLTMLVTTDAEATKNAVDGFSKVFTEAVESAVKERLKGNPPKSGGGGTTSMTKAEILAIKDQELRQKKMLENKHLFNF